MLAVPAQHLRTVVFGPVVMAGIGGIRAELLGDIVLALAPHANSAWTAAH
ncbi:acetate--CoA ligase family protein [Streptomyces sp. NBC_01618]|nr:acetate--CoA ligase family protein [Streptomyces sp. NBC_01618]